MLRFSYAPKAGAARRKACWIALRMDLPVLVNNDASFRDYPDDVVVKLSPDPSVSEIGAALVEIRADHARRDGFARRGLSYVREQHDPKHCAAQYAAAIHEFVALDAARSAGSYAQDLAPHLVALTDAAAGAKLAAGFFDSRTMPRFARPRLFIDASHIAQDDHKTGIPRVMKEIVRSAYCSARADFEAVAVEREGRQALPGAKVAQAAALVAAAGGRRSRCRSGGV